MATVWHVYVGKSADRKAAELQRRMAALFVIDAERARNRTF